jgi:hypothetical protein
MVSLVPVVLIAGYCVVLGLSSREFDRAAEVKIVGFALVVITLSYVGLL